MENITIKELKEIKEVLLCKINKDIIAQIPLIFIDTQNANFDDINNLTLKVSKEYVCPNTKKIKEYFAYEELITERLLCVDGEYYVIKEISVDDILNIKTITAYSCEKKLEKHNIVLNNVSLALLDFNEDEDNEVQSFDKILYEQTGWRLGYVDYKVRYMDNGEFKIRIQDSVDTTFYSFITETIKEQFCCIPIFDSKNKLINLYDIDSFGDELKLILSKDNYIKSLQKTYNSNDIITRLKLVGNEEKCKIEEINPTGFDYIEDYSYFIERNEMSEELIRALNLFDELAIERNAIWKELILKKEELELELSSCNANEKILSNLVSELKNIIQAYQDEETDIKKYNLNTIEEELDKNIIELNEVGIIIENLEKELRKTKEDIVNINTLLRRETSLDKKGKPIFTEKLLNELKEFIYYDTYSDSSFVDANEMLKSGKFKLSNICKPTVEFSIDIIDFTERIISNKFNQPHTIELGLGDVIALYNSKTNTEEYVYFIGWEKDYKSKSLKLTFSNKKTNQDVTKTIADLLRETKNNKKLINANKYFWNNQKQNIIDESINQFNEVNLNIDIPKLETINKVTDIVLDKKELLLNKEENKVLTVEVLPENATNKNVKWSSSDESIATVDSNGIVVGVNYGECIISVVSEDSNKFDNCKVVIEEPKKEETIINVESIKLNDIDMRLKLGEMKYLVPSIVPNNATNKEVVFECDNKNIATVTSEGLVSSVSVGSCNITVTSKENPNINVTCPVRIVSNEAIEEGREPITDLSSSLVIGHSRVVEMNKYGFLEGMTVDSKVGVSGGYFYTEGKNNRLTSYPSNPKCIIVILGVNDCYNSGIYQTKQLLTALKNKYPVHQIFLIKEIGVGNGYSYGSLTATALNNQLEVFNNTMKEFCSTLNINWLDCSNGVVVNGFLKAEYTYDNVHLWKDGYKVLWNNIQTQVLLELNKYINNSSQVSNKRQAIINRAEEIVQMCKDGKAWYSQYNRTIDWNNKQVIRCSSETISYQGSKVTHNQPGKGKYGFDCSSFVGVCYQAGGFDFMKGLSCASGTLQAMAKKHNAKAWRYQDSGFNECKPGDIVMFANDNVTLTKNNMFTVRTHHTAIYMGDGYIAEASGFKNGILKRKRTPNNKWFFLRIEELSEEDNSTPDTTPTDTKGGYEPTGTVEYGGITYSPLWYFDNAIVTSYQLTGPGTGGYGCNPNEGIMCASHNLPYGTKILVPRMVGKAGIDKTGVFICGDAGSPGFDFDLNIKAELYPEGRTNLPVYVLEWGDNMRGVYSFTDCLNSKYWGTTWKKFFTKYLNEGGQTLYFHKFVEDDKTITSHKNYPL